MTPRLAVTTVVVLSAAVALGMGVGALVRDDARRLLEAAGVGAPAVAELGPAGPPGHRPARTAPERGGPTFQATAWEARERARTAPARSVRALRAARRERRRASARRAARIAAARAPVAVPVRPVATAAQPAAATPAATPTAVASPDPAPRARRPRRPARTTERPERPRRPASAPQAEPSAVEAAIPWELVLQGWAEGAGDRGAGDGADDD